MLGLDSSLLIGFGLLAAFASFTLSATAGLGGSLILVPAMSLVLGPKEGIAVSALLLGSNNVLKTLAYRRTVPIVPALGILLGTLIGAFFGAALLVSAPEHVVGIVVIASFFLAFVFERRNSRSVQRVFAPILALLAGAVSGFSGTSGPMKGISIRSLGLDRLHFVGAASMVSLLNDLTKTTVFVNGGLLDRTGLLIVLAAIPLMLLGTYLGYSNTSRMSERIFAGVFWTVMMGYSARVIATLL